MSVERQLAELADGQHGVFARWHLPAAPRISRAIHYRVRCRRLRVLYPGVYAYGHRRLTPSGHRLAAALAYGPTAVVSYRSAGASLDLLRTGQRRVDVPVPGTSRRSRPGIRVHRARELRPDEVTVVDGVPVTTVTRTICDLASVLTFSRLRRVVEAAERNESLDLGALRTAVETRPTRRGARALRRLLAEYQPAPATRSTFERDFLEVVEAGGLPAPLVNHVIEGHEVDIYWPDWKLVVELDSRGFHSSPRAFEADPVRDARLQRRGLRVLRVTWRRLHSSPRAVLADIRALAASCERSGEPVG